ncbi:GMC oxidoreductase [Streptomyces sp. NPDC046881]|uniref:GMC oxidoreductase n=1 Tax=Streptomyces sp. NPDC046881 TaxID=3155374 RepID=UPI0033D4349D
MMHLPESCQVAVVGSGIAGLTLARELALSGVRSCVVLEAGPAGDLRHKNSLPGDVGLRLWHTAAADPYFARSWSSDRPPHFHRASGIRRRVGGRSLYWHGVCLPIENDVLRAGAWPPSVVDALGSVSGSGLYADTARRLEDWLGEPLDASRGPLEAAVLKWLLAQGYFARTVPQAARFDRATGIRVPYSPVEHWLREDPGGLPPVHARCEVLEMTPTASGRVALTLDSGGSRRVLVAQRVCLAAGTLPTTVLAGRLMMRVAGTDECRLEGLNDHIVQGFTASVPRRVLALPRLPGDALCYVPRTDPTESNLFLDVTETSDPDRVLLTAWTMGEQVGGDSAVRVPRDPGAPALVDVRLSERDHRVIRHQTRQLRELAERLAGNPVLTGEWHFAAGSPEYLPARTRARAHGDDGDGIAFFPYVYPLGSVDHESGTLPLGSPLADDYGALRCLPAVRVAGPAAFPRSGAANPSLTTMALAAGQARATSSTL